MGKSAEYSHIMHPFIIVRTACQLRFGLIIIFIKIYFVFSRKFTNPMLMEKYRLAQITRNQQTTNVAQFIVYHKFDSHKPYLQYKCTNPVYIHWVLF